MAERFITLTRRNGEEIVLEYLDTVEYEGKIYMAFFPTIDEETDPEEARGERGVRPDYHARGARRRRGRTGHPGQ